MRKAGAAAPATACTTAPARAHDLGSARATWLRLRLVGLGRDMKFMS